MKNIKKLCNLQLYVEGLLQTKWIALVLFLTGILVLHPFSDGSMGPEVLAYFCFICTLIMTFLLFGFLNKRAGSDYFHMLSQSRLAIYTGYCLAILTWVGLILLLLVGSCYLFRDNNAFGSLSNMQSFEISDSGDVLTIFGLFYQYLMAICILTLGAAALGMSITGNRIANILATFAILFVPRILLNNYIDCFYRVCPYVSQSDLLGKITDSSYHVLYGMGNAIGYEMVFSYNYEDICTNMRIAVIYSSVVGLIYMILGGICFYRRRSEAAEQASVNRFFQIALRVVITLAICIVPIMNLAEYYAGQSEEKVLLESFLWYVFIAFLWLLIEFLTTRNGKKVIKSLVQLPIPAVFNIIMMAALVGNVKSVAENIPDVDDVTSIEILANEDESLAYMISSEEGVSDYMFRLLSEAGCLKLTSEDAKEKLLTELAEDIGLCHSNYTEYEEMTSVEYNWTVRFHQGEKSITRIIYLDEELSDMIWDYVRENANNTYEYPFPMRSPKEMSLVEETMDVPYYCNEIGHWMRTRDYSKLYAQLYEEWEAIRPPLGIFMNSAHCNADGVIDCLRVSTGTYSYYVPITINTPKSLALVANCVNDYASAFNFDWFAQDIKDGKTYGPMSVKLCEKGSDEIIEQTFEAYSGPDRVGKELTKEDLEKWQKLLASHDKEEVKADETMLYVSYFDSSFSESRWFNLTDEETEQVKVLMGIR